MGLSKNTKNKSLKIICTIEVNIKNESFYLTFSSKALSLCFKNKQRDDIGFSKVLKRGSKVNKEIRLSLLFEIVCLMRILV